MTKTKTNLPEFVFLPTNPEYRDLVKRSMKRAVSLINTRFKLRLGDVSQNQPWAAVSSKNSVVSVSRVADLTVEVLEHLASAAINKHIVFTSGQPVEVIPSLLRALKVRSPDRIHFSSKPDKKNELALIHRLVLGAADKDENVSIVDAWFEASDLVLLSASFERLVVPRSKLEQFLGTSLIKQRQFEIDEDGRFLYWPHADVHLGWKQLDQLIHPTKAIGDKGKSKEFAVRYGKAIRQLRVSIGLRQNDIAGLDERQVRRFERGEQFPSTRALESLAKSHNLDVGDYMKRLASLVSSI
ncbi:MAG: helix-turn-helix domain-containing protein [Pirellula sp.]|jgi:hypothetical protein